jgi:isopentenyl-diphosphate Delta-isomerase
MTEERVILVDASDRAVGEANKMAAHREGLLHRAFSVFVLDADDHVLMQRRASGKYHSGGLWANSCCSHPRPGEGVEEGALRRLKEEMGFVCDVTLVGAVLYRADVGGGLVEHEYDHILIGRWTGVPSPDPAEVEEWRWVGVTELRRWVLERPETLAPWFAMAFQKLEELGVPPFGTQAP